MDAGHMETSGLDLSRVKWSKTTALAGKLREMQKTTTAYVEQKTCSAMEALGLLGNSIYTMMENMMDVLEGLPNDLQDTIDSVPHSGTAGFDPNRDTSPTADNDLPPLAVIQMMQKDWNRIAQLIELNLPAAKRLNTVANASHSPTPM